MRKKIGKKRKQKVKKAGMFVLTMCLLMTGCGNSSSPIGNADGDDKSGPISDFGAAQEATSEEKNNSGSAEDFSAFSGDWEAEEEYGYSPFWLKYAALGSLEEKDFSDVVLADTFTCGTVLMDILSGYDDCYFCVYNCYGSNLMKDSLLEDVLNYTDEMVGHNLSVTLRIYPEIGSNTPCAAVEVYNLTDSEITIKECIENNQFILDSKEIYQTVNQMLGLEFEEKEFRSDMAEVMDILGKPTGVYYMGNSTVNTDREGEEEFDDAVQKGGGWIVYNLLYDKGDYLICISISENNYFGKYTGEGSLIYITKDLYTYRNTTSSGKIVEEEKIYEFE